MAKRRDMGIWRPVRDAIWGEGERRRGMKKGGDMKNVYSKAF